MVTLGVPEEAQTTQRFGITKSVGCTFVLGLSLVRGHKEGAHLWGVREEKHHLNLRSFVLDGPRSDHAGVGWGPMPARPPELLSQGIILCPGRFL